MKRWIVGAAVLVALAGIGQAEGAIILSESFTGAELVTDARASFPSRSPVVQGTSLFFDTGIDYREKLVTLQLVPANTLSATDPTIVSIFMELTVQPSPSASYPTDHDPCIGIGDGSRIFAFQAADNSGGEGDAISCGDLGDHGDRTGPLTLDTGAGYPAIGETLSVQTRFTLNGDCTEVFGAVWHHVQ